MAELLQATSGEVVYPVACGGWALTNEMNVLTSLPGWNRAKRLIWLLNTSDFDTIGEAGREYDFPTRYPLWMAPWLVSRQLCRRFSPVEAPDGVEPRLRKDNLARFRRVAEEFPGEIFIVRYPRIHEDTSRETYFEQLAGCATGIALIDMAQAVGWDDTCYKDNIHPNASGTALLAKHIFSKAFAEKAF